MSGETLVSNPNLLLQVSPDGDVRTLSTNGPYLPTVHPDGPLVVEEDSGDGVNGVLTTVDIGYGGGGRRWPLTGRGGVPVVLEDGSIVAVTSTIVLEPYSIALTINRAYLDGHIETTPIAGCPWWVCWDFDPTHPGLALPNGKGGYLIQFNDRTNADPSILGVDANGQITGITNMWLGTTQLVIGETSAMAIGPLPFWANAYNLDDIVNNHALQTHLGLMQSITLEGSPMGGAGWMPPVGDCGNSYAGWDTWVDLGDCAGPQPVIDITSVIAEPGGGFTVSLSDGSVISSNPQLEALDPAFLQPRWDGSYIGTGANNALMNLSPGAHGAVFANSPFPGYGANQSGSAAATPRRGIFVGGRRVPTSNLVSEDYYHTYIRIAPTNQARWQTVQAGDPVCGGGSCFDTKNSRFANPGDLFATISAHPSDKLGIFRPSLLLAQTNDPDELNALIAETDWEKLQVSVVVEDIIIAALFKYHSNYQLKDPLPYFVYPTLGVTYYNSNSYTKGLLDIVHLAPPRFTTRDAPPRHYYPGWKIPVPNDAFNR